ncbi:hypothetical protein JCM11641_002279 [Rhodosporidiobolus odoratus]
MSSFRRRQAAVTIPGTRTSPSSPSPLVSTGLPALDDLIGGGLPLSSLLLIESDHPTNYSHLILKYFIAQGLECGHDVAVLAAGGEGGPEGVVEGLMATENAGTAKDTREDREERDREEQLREKMKIAFRYEGMKAHQTSLPEQAASSTGEDTYSSIFDLTSTRQLSSSDRKLLHLINVDDFPSAAPNELYDTLYHRIEKLINDGGFRQGNESSAPTPRQALRLALSNFGSPAWSAVSPSVLFSFLLRLRHLLSTTTCVTLLTFPSHLFSSSPSSSPSSPLLIRLSHVAHGILRLTSFSSSPLLSSQYPRHSGLLSFPKLPSPPSGSGGLIPPGSKLSVLRGLGGGGQGRDNLIGFRVKRRRFVVEVLSEDPVAAAGGEEEVERKKRERRKRVEEANRREREVESELAEGEGIGKGREEATDVLLRKVGERVASVRIGGEEPGLSGKMNAKEGGDGPLPLPATAPKKSSFKKKGVRMGGVSFGGADEADEKKEPKPSVSSMLHKRPDLLDF